MRFIVTGCGQSGTHYAAAVLTAAGLDCGHERVFNRWNPGFNTCPDWAADGAPAGDSSFAAVPFLDGPVDAGTVVVHLVRPPVDVIRSVLGRRQMDHPGDWPWVRFVDHHTNILRVPAGPRRAAAYWLRWNLLAEQRAHLTWRVHELGVADIEALADRAGLDVDRARVGQALADTPRDLGAGPRAFWRVDVEDLAARGFDVRPWADRWGVPLTVDDLDEG